MISLLPRTEQVIKSWPTNRSRRWLASLLQKAELDPNLVAVIAVGSAIRTGITSEDLDLVAICRDKSIFRSKAPIEVDLRAFDLRDVESGLRQGQDLLTWTVRFGKPLYDPQGVWAEIVSRWEDSLLLPDPATARQRASVALRHRKIMEASGDEEAAVDLRISYLTHLARAALSQAGVYPASRPELPKQLLSVGQTDLAHRLKRALAMRDKRKTHEVAV